MLSDRRILVHCVQQYCYCRETKYCPHEAPADFAYVIQVKENAPDLLRKALSRLPVDLVMTGDYQPAERRFGLSWRMLEVCLELGLPASVLERSPLVVRDLDLLNEINQHAPSIVFFSMISAPDSPTYERVRQMENLAPRMEKRYAAWWRRTAPLRGSSDSRSEGKTYCQPHSRFALGYFRSSASGK